MRWEHVDLEGGFLHVQHQLQRVNGVWQEQDPESKTSLRRLRLSPDTLDTLRRQRAHRAELRFAAGQAWPNTGYVFTTPWGRSYHASSAYHQFQWLLQAAGLRRMRVHDLRHGTA